MILKEAKEDWQPYTKTSISNTNLFVGFRWKPNCKDENCAQPNFQIKPFQIIQIVGNC